jgi:hypothetical protein
MTFDSALFDPTRLRLTIDPVTQTQAWQHSQAFATPTSQWNAYLNQLCLQTLLPWLREEAPQVQPAPSPVALDSIWELVNGAAVAWANRRLVIIPTETIDLDEIRIPQEWVDIPDWAADYYLAVQVNPDDAWLRVAGFLTHRQVKQQSQFDPIDRTYCLAEADLIPDLSVLWIAQQLTIETTRTPLTAPPALSTPEAANLIQRLGNAEIINPRLAIPFERWAALLAHGGWRQQLAERRRGLPEQHSLVQWLQSGISTVAQQWGWSRVDYQAGIAAARSSEESSPVAALSRIVTIAAQRYELQIIPVDVTANIWRFELTSLAPSGLLPAGMTLRLLTENLQPFEGNEDMVISDVDRLYIEVALEAGEGLVWEIEPTPQDYDREILRF